MTIIDSPNQRCSSVFTDMARPGSPPSRCSPPRSDWLAAYPRSPMRVGSKTVAVQYALLSRGARMMLSEVAPTKEATMWTRFHCRRATK